MNKTVRTVLLTLAAAALAVLLIGGLVKVPIAFAGQKIELWFDGGGLPAHYGDMARRWKRNGDYLIIRDMQVSSAALAILEAKRLGVRMCYGKSGFNARPMLYLHQTKIGDPRTGRWKFYDEPGKRYGLKSPINGYRKVHPKDIGIPACPKGLKPDVKITPIPYIYRLR